MTKGNKRDMLTYTRISKTVKPKVIRLTVSSIKNRLINFHKTAKLMLKALKQLCFCEKL